MDGRRRRGAGWEQMLRSAAVLLVEMRLVFRWSRSSLSLHPHGGMKHVTLFIHHLPLCPVPPKAAANSMAPEPVFVKSTATLLACVCRMCAAADL